MLPLPIADTLTLEAALAAPWLPGMQPGERAILRAWLQRQGAAFRAFGFNVRVGQGADAPLHFPESARRFVRKTTQKRIDVVAFLEESVALYEVKIQANLGALGQMLGYRHLWPLTYPAWPIAEGGVICHLISADTAAVLTHHRMPFYLEADVVLPPLVTVPPPG